MVLATIVPPGDTDHSPARLPQRGFSLIEILIVVAMLTLLMSMAVPAYQNFTERAHVRAATADIGRMQLELDRWLLSTQNPVPATLAEAGIDVGNDPWGNPYRYRRVDGTSPGTARKNASAAQLNSDYDLYSMGKDGGTADSTSSPAGSDDIVRAGNGGYVGRANKY